MGGSRRERSGPGDGSRARSRRTAALASTRLARLRAAHYAHPPYDRRRSQEGAPLSGKQAVVLIHGIGEQRPMDTLRAFVDAVWVRDAAIHDRFSGHDVWSKPDNVSRNFELRRLTTPRNIADRQTDFFEFYWAHLMQGTSYGHVFAWARTLLVRPPGTVPRQLRAVYWLILILLLAATGLLGFAIARWGAKVTPLLPWFSLLGSLLVLPAVAFVLLRVVGDAARYLHVAPANIQARHQIRAAGVALLEELHDPLRGYDRIVIVGHSLGSVIGYDMLTSAWVDFHHRHEGNAGSMEALEALEALARSERPAIEAVQAAQRRYLEELNTNGNPWRVTDFITVGSPLAHAAILLASDAAELRRKQEDREFPRCLPELETLRRDNVEVQRFSYEADRADPNRYRIPHHAAVFAPTRWTNLYFPCRAIVRGDLIGGPVNGILGDHIRDLPVATRERRGWLAHTQYWHPSRGSYEAPHILALREVLDLTDRGRPKA